MNVYDTVNKLAEEIKNSDEYKNFKKVKQDLENNPDLKSKITEFEKKRQELQFMTVSGNKVPDDRAKEIQEQYMELIKDEKALIYFDSEMKFSVMISDVNKIIGDAIKDVLR